MLDWIKNLLPERATPIAPEPEFERHEDLSNGGQTWNPFRDPEPDGLDEDAERLASYGGEPEADDEAEMEECDACGELKPAEGGLHQKGMVHAAMIDPPDESWTCRDCVAQAEAYEEDRMMDAERPMSDRDYYLYEK